MRPILTRLRALIGIMALLAAPAVTSANSADSIIYSGSWGKLDVHDNQESDGPRVALALSGGASRGLAHIGVLRALDESGIRIAGIAGTSMGGIIGALYSAGYSPDSIQALAREIDFSSLFTNSPRRRSLFLTQREEIDQTLVTVRFESFKPSIPTELSSAQRVTELLTMLTLRQNMAANRNFLKLKIPFSTVATDVTRGESVTLSSGNLAEALRGTMAFPLAISGVEWGDRLLMDGGILKPAPVDVAREICGDDIPVLLVNATKELQKKDKIDDPFEVAQQVTTIMSMRELQEEIESADYLITPSLDEISTSDFGLVRAIVDSGYGAAQGVIQKILDDHTKQLNSTRFSISNCETESSAPSVKNLCDSLKKLNKSMTLSELESTLAQMYSTGGFMLLEVQARLDSQNNNAVILQIEATPAPVSNDIQVEVSGAEFIEPDTLREKIQSYIESLRTLEVDSVKLFVESIYADRGMTLASVEDCYYNPGTSTLVVVVDEAIARWVNVYGNVRTRFSYIRDRIDMQPGKPLALKSIANTYRDLYTSGLFKRVIVDAEPTDSGVAVNVAVEEDNSLQMRFGYHWHDEYHSEGLVELEEMNSFGIGLRAGARGRLSERRKGAHVYLANDRLFRTYVAADMEAEYRELDRSLYDSDGEEIGRQSEIHRGVSFRLGQHLSRFGFVSGEIYVGRVNFSDDIGNQFSQYDSRLLRIRSVVDDLDRTYFPTSGRRTEIHFESAGRVLGGETEYTKWFGMLETYISISRRLNFHPRISAMTSSSALPSPERFYIGGLRTFPGFRTAELSGAKALLANFDMRYRVMGRIYLMGEYATGNTYEEDEEIRIDNVRHGWGAGVGIDLPIGPVYIMYGRASEGHERTYFQAGLEF